MPKQHTVRDGECISSIADRYGFFTDTIWNHPANSELKTQREDPNLLVPGDEVTIPDKKKKEVAKSTDASHRFKKKGVPSLFRLQVMYAGKARSKQDYHLSIDDALFLKGTTDADGVLEEFIPPNARRGKLTIGSDRYEMKLKFGFLEPPNTIRGIQQRLNNLGHSCGLEDGEWREELGKAIGEFQARCELPVTGKTDEQTWKKLEEIHDNVNEGRTQENSSAGSDEDMDVD